MLDRRQRVAQAGARVARRLDQHIEPGGRDQGARIIADMGAAAGQRLAEIAGGKLLLRPAGALQRAPRPLGVQVGDPQDMQPRGQPRLRQEHGAELAAADQPDPHRPAGLGAFREQTMEIHARLQSRHAARCLRGDRGCCVVPNCWYNKKKEAKGLPNGMML